MKRTALFLLMGLAVALGNAAQVKINFSGSFDLAEGNYSGLLGTTFTGYIEYDTSMQHAGGGGSLNALEINGYDTYLTDSKIYINTNAGVFNDHIDSVEVWNMFNQGTFPYTDKVSFYGVSLPREIEITFETANMNWLQSAELSSVNYNNFSQSGSNYISLLLFNNENSDVFRSNDAQVTSIQISEAPVPAAAWLMGSGLLGLTAAARRKKI